MLRHSLNEKKQTAGKASLSALCGGQAAFLIGVALPCGTRQRQKLHEPQRS